MLKTDFNELFDFNYLASTWEKIDFIESVYRK